MNEPGIDALGESLRREQICHSLASSLGRDTDPVHQSIVDPPSPRVLTNTLLLGAGAALGRLSMVLFRYMAVRRLNPDGYGAFALLSSLFVALLPLAHLNLGTSLVYLISMRPSGTAALFRSTSMFALGASVICGVGLALCVPRAALPNLPMWVIWLSPIGFFASSLPTLVEGAFRGHLQIKQAAFITASAGISRLLLLAVLSLALSTTAAVYGAFLFAPLLACLCGTVALRQVLSSHSEVTEAPPQIGKALRFALPVALTNILMGFFLYFPRSSVISAGLAEVGAVDLALLAFSVFQMGVASSASALLPHLARERSVSLRRALFAITGCVAIYEIVVWLTNADLRGLKVLGLTEYANAAFHLRIMAFACPALLHQTLRATELQVFGRGTTVLVLTAIGLLGQLGLSPLLRHIFGAPGATIACAVSLFVLSALLEWTRRSLQSSLVS